MTCLRAVALLVQFALGAMLAAQTTWVVSGGGAALQNAITIALPGDVLDVQPGSYTAVVCSKGLRIALRAGAQIDGGGTTALTASNLPANEVFQVDGGVVMGIAASQCAGTIVVDSVSVQLLAVFPFTLCSGPIVFDGVSYPTISPYTSGHLQFSNCPQVTFRNSTVPQVTITASRVVLQNCTVRPYGFSAPGVSLVSGALTIAGGYTTGSAAMFFTIARPAIRIDTGELVLTGGAVVEALQYLAVSSTAPGILANGGTIRRDPSVNVIGTPPIAGPATLFTAPIPSVAVTHTATTMNVTTRGQASDVLVTFAGLLAPPFPTPWGDAWLSPGDPILDISVLPASGVGGFSYTFASVPPFVLLTLQSVAISPTGALQIGSPTRFAWN